MCRFPGFAVLRPPHRIEPVLMHNHREYISIYAYPGSWEDPLDPAGSGGTHEIPRDPMGSCRILPAAFCVFILENQDLGRPKLTLPWANHGHGLHRTGRELPRVGRVSPTRFRWRRRSRGGLRHGVARARGEGAGPGPPSRVLLSRVPGGPRDVPRRLRKGP